MYKESWTLFIGKELTTYVEEDILYDQDAVAILKNGELVDHMPCTIEWFSFFKRISIGLGA